VPTPPLRPDGTASSPFPLVSGRVQPRQVWEATGRRGAGRRVEVRSVNATPWGARFAEVVNLDTGRPSSPSLSRTGNALPGYRLASDPNSYRAAAYPAGSDRQGPPAQASAWGSREDAERERASLLAALARPDAPPHPLAVVLERRGPDEGPDGRGSDDAPTPPPLHADARAPAPVP